MPVSIGRESPTGLEGSDDFLTCTLEKKRERGKVEPVRKVIYHHRRMLFSWTTYSPTFTYDYYFTLQ